MKMKMSKWRTCFPSSRVVLDAIVDYDRDVGAEWVA